MSRLTDLISQVKANDPELGKELEREFKSLASRRSFGLNFERHRPESVELPGRPVRKGDTVRVLPPRGSTGKGDQRLWKVRGIERVDGKRTARIELIGGTEQEAQQVAAEDLVVVAEFRDYIYPGLVSTGKVERGGDKPYHTVINGENFHALEALTFTHRGKIDAIYIDPPYNTGARDWKYNNDYVEGEDLYRHSKWLAMMERRLLVAKELLNPTDSVLIVTIDEKEYLRLGLLLEQVFPEAQVQMISNVINRAGSPRSGRFSRVDEYIFYVFFGKSVVTPWTNTMLADGSELDKSKMPTVWFTAVRRGSGASRAESKSLFYPVVIDRTSGKFIRVGDPVPHNVNRESVKMEPNELPIWPLGSEGQENRWRFSAELMRNYFANGTARLGRRDPTNGLRPVTYLQPGTLTNIENGTFVITGKSPEGALILELAEGGAKSVVPRTVWSQTSHFARDHGSHLINYLLGGKRFDFPKSLYAVEDTLRFIIKDKPQAVVVDFFAGSGTTAHAVMRLNKQDSGTRYCIMVTNNEVSESEQRALREQGLRPGDTEWEKWGICDYITKPRIEAAITGKTPDGKTIKGDYKFTDEFPMADGFEENAEFFSLTYETPVAISHNRAFNRIAPLLWMRAGSEGRRIDNIPVKGWDVADTYGLLIDLDQAAPFTEEVDTKGAIRIAYIVTDDDRRFQSITRRLPDGVEPVRLYESYLTNFRFSMGR
ncbi:MAG: site-specific DNA-methyltransferase [Proteobacteria bacterium]|nr:site-specific DNA-methyltransferase [Pseudomonadota bacterium]MBU1715304.1 site-specific DNA-methyltransferase [Pseudomonadota bacterium]